MRDRRKAIYLRAICGIRKAQIQNKRVCFLTLTTNSASVIGLTKNEMMTAIARDWNIFRTYLQQKYGKFEYLQVTTNEGYGVIHILITGLPFIWWGRLLRIWNSIHGGGFIWISKFRGSPEDMASYLMSQYLANQKCKFRFKMSNNFICKEFVKWWRIIKICSRDHSREPKQENGYKIYFIDFNKLKRNFIIWITRYIETGLYYDYC